MEVDCPKQCTQGSKVILTLPSFVKSGRTFRTTDWLPLCGHQLSEICVCSPQPLNILEHTQFLPVCQCEHWAKVADPRPNAPCLDATQTGPPNNALTPGLLSSVKWALDSESDRSEGGS